MTSPDGAFRFAFDDVVCVIGRDPELAPIYGELGVVVGRGDDRTRPGYGVWIYSAQRVWSVEEDELEATGGVDPANPSSVVLRVGVDERGAGHLIGVFDRDERAEGLHPLSRFVRSPIFWAVVVLVVLALAAFG